MDFQIWLIPLLSLIGGAAGAAIINGWFGIKKLQADRRDEHKRWLRDKKQDACVEFIAGCEVAFYRFRDLHGAEAELDETDLDAEVILYWKVETTAPISVSSVAEEMLEGLIRSRAVIQMRNPDLAGEFQTQMKAYATARGRFAAAVRRDLEVVD